MDSSKRTLTLIAAIVMISLAAFNIYSVVQPINPGVTELDTAQEDVVDGIEVGGIEDELIEDVGGLTSPTGIAVLAISLLIIAVGVVLLTGRNWQMGAIILLGLDMLLKILNIISQFAVGESDILLSVLVIAIEVAVIAVLYRAWTQTSTAADTRANQASRPIQESR